MRKKVIKSIGCLMALLFAFCIMSMAVDVKACELEVVKADSGTLTGTLGDNGGFNYIYDENTKTLTISGKDSGLQILNLADEAEKIVLHDCELSGDVSRLFYDLYNLKTVEFDNVDTSMVTSMKEMFGGCSSLASLDVSCFDTSQVTDMFGMFSFCNGLTSLNISGFDTSQVTDMGQMFMGCRNLMELDVSSFDTSNVTNMWSVFTGCSSLTNIDVSGFNTAQVKDMGQMFASCKKLQELNVSGFDTSQVTSMYAMFGSCESLESLNVSNFNTSQVTDMSNMFFKCSAVTDLNVSGFDTSQVIDMDCMFKECSSLTELDASGFDTSQVTDMESMFSGCSSLKTLNISGFDTSKVTEVSWMFYLCKNLAIIDTPKMMAEGQSIELPAEFLDPNGNTTLTITPAYCSMRLKKPGRSIVMESDSSELTVNGTMQLMLSIDNAAQDVSVNTEFIWSVDSDNVVTVSESGIVTGIGMGTAVVTCENKDNAVEMASIEITIKIPFSDINTGDWQYPYVVYAYENNLMSGKGNGNFDMNGRLTRAEFVQVLYSYTDKPDITYEQQFIDVAEKDWFANAVVWAKQNSVVAGNPDGSFGIYDNITREQLVVMLYQYAKNNGMVVEELTGDLNNYEDVNKVSTWATEALAWAVQNNIISGKNRDGVNYLDPKGDTTRGECATMMMRYVELANT